MSRRPGSRSSRSQRRAERERAERARLHGLPERPPAPERVRAVAPEGASDGSEPASADSGGAPPQKRAIPLAVKLVAVAFVILLGVYLLGRYRDQALLQGAAAISSLSSVV